MLYGLGLLPSKVIMKEFIMYSCNIMINWEGTDGVFSMKICLSWKKKRRHVCARWRASLMSEVSEKEIKYPILCVCRRLAEQSHHPWPSAALAARRRAYARTQKLGSTAAATATAAPCIIVWTRRSLTSHERDIEVKKVT